jgi:hypothetical protein
MADFAGVNETTIGWHLQANCYPPLSSRLIQPCLDAIDAYNEEDPQRIIDMGGELANGRTTMKAWEIVSGLHLEAFIGVGVEVEL